MLSRKVFSLFAIGYLLLAINCSPPPVENIYRKHGIFPGGINVPVAFLVNEWAGKAKVMGSAWLIDGGNGVLFSAKHVVDAFLNDRIELGGSECKIFLYGRVYDCVVARVPPLRDAVVLKLTSPFNSSELPKPYKIATEKVKIGDKLFIQGLHPHPKEIRDANEREGFKDTVMPIFRTFYELRAGNECVDTEIVFDSLEAKVVELGLHIKIDDQGDSPMDKLKYDANSYFRVETSRNHKFSFGGLSGGGAVRLNKDGEPEAVGIVTAERPVILDYDENGDLVSPCGMPPMVSNTMMITPIESVADETEYARRMR